jgi:hypothetical protein
MKKLWLLFMIGFVCPVVFAQDNQADNATELAKAAQNPVADMISLPFQWNTYFETGPKGETMNTLVIQPVIPFNLSNDWNLITRPIIPLIDMPPLTEAQDRNQGLGNIQLQTFFSPVEKIGGWIIGFGPCFEFPTNSGPDNRFGSDNWSAGPAFVALQINGSWVYGGLINHLWSYYGSDPEVSTTTIQPFLNYNMKGGWYLSASPVITANWNTDSDRQMWTVPVGGGVGRVFKMGNQPMNMSLKLYHNVESPRSGSETQLQFQLQFLFPK